MAFHVRPGRHYGGTNNDQTANDNPGLRDIEQKGSVTDPRQQDEEANNIKDKRHNCLSMRNQTKVIELSVLSRTGGSSRTLPCSGRKVFGKRLEARSETTISSPNRISSLN